MGLHSPPCADQDGATIKGGLLAEEIIAAAVGGWVVADKAQRVRKLRELCNLHIINLLVLSHGVLPQHAA